MSASTTAENHHGWAERPPLRQGRAGLTVVALDDRILAIGGFDDTTTFDVVESRALSGSGQWRRWQRHATTSPPRCWMAAST
jgi:hypothetical protein